MRDPVITPSGITYDRKDLEDHLQVRIYFIVDIYYVLYKFLIVKDYIFFFCNKYDRIDLEDQLLVRILFVIKISSKKIFFLIEFFQVFKVVVFASLNL